MISRLAKDDYEELLALGLPATLEDFDRLNCLALRLTDGAESSAANYPRVGFAEGIPFYQPTCAAFAWYLKFVERAPFCKSTKDAAWFYALRYARMRGAFDGLDNEDAIERAVTEWLAGIHVTMDEIARACRYAATGFDDARAARRDGVEAETDDANLEILAARVTETAAAVGAPPRELEIETPQRLNALCAAADRVQGRPSRRDESRLRADYDLTRREIIRRLRAEKAAKEAATDGK